MGTQPKVDNPKQQVSLRLDPKIVAAYKATGEGRQSRINDILARETSHAEVETAAIKGSLKPRYERSFGAKRLGVGAY